MKFASVILSFSLAALSIGPATAASNVWTIDSEHSAVTFRIKHMTVAAVTGHFKSVSGHVNFDGENLRNATVEATINTESIDTDSPKRDEHLKSKSFFAASDYPLITFKSQKVVPDQSGKFKIKGIVSIHGYAREVDLDAQPLKQLRSDDPSTRRLVTSATTLLDRKDFGISMGVLDKGGALIGDKVSVTLNIQLVHPATAANPGKSLNFTGREIKRLQVFRVADGPGANMLDAG